MYGEADLLSRRVLSHGFQQGLATRLHPVFYFDAPGVGHFSEERGADGVDPGQGRPAQAETGDVIADVADFSLVDDEIVIDNSESLDAIATDQVLKLDSGGLPAPVLNPGLPGGAEAAWERAAAAEHDMCHQEVRPCEPIVHHYVIGGQKMTGWQRQLIDVAHEWSRWIAVDLSDWSPPHDSGYAGKGPAACAVEYLDDCLVRFTVGSQIRVEIGQARFGIEIAVNAAYH